MKNEKLIRNLDALLNARGMRKIHLAQALGISDSAVTAWWRGEASPSTVNIDMMCRVFGISRAQLMGYNDISTPPQNTQEVHNIPPSDTVQLSMPLDFPSQKNVDPVTMKFILDHLELIKRIANNKDWQKRFIWFVRYGDTLFKGLAKLYA